MILSKKTYNDEGKRLFPCADGYLTHKWMDYGIGENRGGISRLLNRRCGRCGLPYKTLYEYRKDKVLKTYHESRV